MHPIVENNISELSNQACLIRHTIDVEDRDWLTECASGDFVYVHPVDVNEGTSRSTVHKGLGAALDSSVR